MEGGLCPGKRGGSLAHVSSHMRDLVFMAYTLKFLREMTQKGPLLPSPLGTPRSPMRQQRV